MILCDMHMYSIYRIDKEDVLITYTPVPVLPIMFSLDPLTKIKCGFMYAFGSDNITVITYLVRHFWGDFIPQGLGNE